MKIIVEISSILSKKTDFIEIKLVESTYTNSMRMIIENRAYHIETKRFHWDTIIKRRNLYSRWESSLKHQWSDLEKRQLYWDKISCLNLLSQCEWSMKYRLF